MAHQQAGDGDAFDLASREKWLALVARAVGGEDFDAAMVGRTDDGLPVHPLPERRVGAPLLARANPERPWTIVQRCDDPDAARANRQAHEDIENGATGIALVFEGAPNAFGYGLSSAEGALERVLEGLPLERIHLRADAHPSSRAMADRLVAHLSRARVDPSRLSLSFGIDSAAVLAGTGRLRMSIEALQASLPQSLAHFFAQGLPGIVLEADGRVYHNAGATEAQELGAILSGAVGHLRLFEQARQAIVYATPHIGFCVSVDQDLFVSMAKIRALRLLWARVQEACSIPVSPATIHAETSWRMVTKLDPETNILRATLATFAAGAGGADTIAVLPHTIAHGLPDAFARRIARNTQLVLAEESRIGFVADPAAGAGGIEALTEDLCAAAWQEFQRIEAEGGLLASLAAGKVQARIEKAAKDRAAAFAEGRRAIVGTTVFPAKAEAPVTTLPAAVRPLPQDGTVFAPRLAMRRIDETIGGTP